MADAVGPESRAAVAAGHGARLRRLDPLLPAPEPFVPGDGADLIAAQVGDAMGLALAHEVRLSPDMPGAMWGALEQHLVTIQVGGPDTRAVTDSLLSMWSRQVALDADGSRPDTAAMLTWPSRDTEPVPALLAHGLTPIMVLAGRPARRSGPSGHVRTVRIRPATIADLEVVTAFRLMALRYDMQFGFVPERAEAPAYARRTAKRALDEGTSWTWLAVDEGVPVGLVSVAPPEQTAWVASMVAAASVAYVGVLSVDASVRGRGIGAALMAHAHRELDAAGVDVTLLHHRLINPRSTPFWNAHGYRPLWTTWETHPASTLR